jgi:hypothetical protein
MNVKLENVLELYKQKVMELEHQNILLKALCAELQAQNNAIQNDNKKGDDNE